MSESILDRLPPLPDQRLRYGAEPLQFGDLRLPEEPGPHPCAVAIHGGFWRNRYTLEHLGHLCAALTAAGIATWSIEYRRIGDPGGGWPGTFQDVVLATRSVFDNAARHDIDPNRIIAIGHSAGGHLASWLAGAGNVPEDSPIRSSSLPLRAAVSLAGVLDLRRAWELRLSEGVVQDLLGGDPDDVPDRYAAASPVELVPGGVPHLLVHGDDDDIVPIELSERYREAATAHGDDVTMLVLPHTGHFELIDPESLVWPEVLAAILAPAG
jgi:acetyl esterase/lipase